MAAHFDLPDIKLFVNIAEANSLTRGAERSHMSLPAASIRIKNLEEGLGVKLLYRTSQGVTLTPRVRRSCIMRGSCCSSWPICAATLANM